MCIKYITTNRKPGQVQSPDDVFFPASARQMKASLSVRLVEEDFHLEITQTSLFTRLDWVKRYCMLINAEKFSAKSNIKASHTPHIVQVQDQIEGHFIKQIVRQSPFCFWNLGFKSNPKFCHSIWTWVSHFYSLSLKMASATHNYRAGQKVVVFWESLVKHSGDKKKGCWNCIHVVVAWTIPPLTIEVCLPSMLRII